MSLADQLTMERVRTVTGTRRMRLRDWESVQSATFGDNKVQLIINTFEVQELVREDRFNRKGWRMIEFTLVNNVWRITFDQTSWDDDFEPYVYEKVGRRMTAEELIEKRDWEKLCHRPGNSKTPLDSYDRVLDPFVRSTDRMERHY